MVPESRIREELSGTLSETNMPGLGERIPGKVRDSYRRGDRRVIVTTDRVSAFDRLVGTVPFKGQALNEAAAFWFEQTQHIIGNHVLGMPDPNVMVVRQCDVVPLEFVVRGYITGVTKTSLWFNYQQGVRNLCGNRLPEGLRKNEELPAPILTPTTKHELHDRGVSRDEAISEGLVDGETFDTLARISLDLYALGVQLAARRGLILVDTKYEFGIADGKFLLIDEVHTPDCSRYWHADSYADLFRAGQEQRALDKEPLRQWLADRGFRGTGTPPPLTDAVRIETSARYIHLCEMLTGKEFVARGEHASDRVHLALLELQRE